MDTWTLQMGYPVVNVIRDYTKKQASLTQKWFLLNPASQNLQDTQHWYVPFTFTTSQEKTFEFESETTWLKPNDAEVVINLNQTDNSSWVIGNLRHTGFLRVNYDKQNWDNLITQLKNDLTMINEINRATLLDDSFNLGRAEMIDQLFFLRMTEYLQLEDDAIPWTAAFGGLNYIGSQLSSCNDAGFIAFKKFYKKLIQNVYDELAWNETLVDDASKIDLQLSVMNIMCSYDDEDCINKAKVYFKNWKENDAK